MYTGQAVNLRRRVYQHKRNGKIPQGGYVDCMLAKDDITYDELDTTEREKINEHNPPLNMRRGGGGRKSPMLPRGSYIVVPTGRVIPVSREPEHKRNILYRFLGYEKVDRAGEVHYLKEPKAVFFMIVELIVKMVLIAVALLAVLGVYLKLSQGVVFYRNLLICMVAIPTISLALFHYIRRNKLFSVMTLITIMTGVFLYVSSYPLPFE